MQDRRGNLLTPQEEQKIRNAKRYLQPRQHATLLLVESRDEYNVSCSYSGIGDSRGLNSSGANVKMASPAVCADSNRH